VPAAPAAAQEAVKVRVNKSSGAFYVVLVSLLGTGAWLCTNIYNSPESLALVFFNIDSLSNKVLGTDPASLKLT
jgi:hypothetical protein